MQENLLEEYEDALFEIAKISDGGMRDSLSLLDQLTAYTTEKITINDVNDVYGTITISEIYNLICKIQKKYFSFTRVTKTLHHEAFLCF